MALFHKDVNIATSFCEVYELDDIGVLYFMANFDFRLDTLDDILLEFHFLLLFACFLGDLFRIEVT